MSWKESSLTIHPYSFCVSRYQATESVVLVRVEETKDHMTVYFTSKC